MRQCRAPAGVTILELLIVISIILFLMAAMFVGLSRMRERTRHDKTVALVEKVATALESYRLKFRVYPPSDTAPTGNEALAYHLTTAFRVKPDPAKGEVLASDDAGPLIVLSSEELQRGKIIDAYAQPLVYKRYLAEDFGKAAKSTIVSFYDPSHNTAAGSKTAVRQFVYSLYSFGSNQKDDNGDGDDITARK